MEVGYYLLGSDSIESVPGKHWQSKAECRSEEMHKVKEEFTEQCEISMGVSAKMAQKGTETDYSNRRLTVSSALSSSSSITRPYTLHAQYGH